MFQDGTALDDRLVAPSPSVAILLATYNGEKYLDQQMRSLVTQTYRDSIIMVRDDKSTDSTPEILAKWADAYPKKISVIDDDLGNVRSAANFSRLMQLCEAQYFAFCDQDDVWLPRKIELLMSEMRRLERERSSNTPILIHSDLTVVDEGLKVVSSSLFQHRKINPATGHRLDRLIVNNVMTGCASLGNRALLELGRPVPEEFTFHDWWLALVAASCGVISTIAESTVLYRQHGRNQVGAGAQRKRSTLWDGRHVIQRPWVLRARMTKAMTILQRQAKLLLDAVGGKMSRRNREFLRAFCMPERRAEVVLLPWEQRIWLRARYTFVYARALPFAFRWCY